MATTRDYFGYLNDQIDFAPANSQEELQAAEVISNLMEEHGLETRLQEFDTPASGNLPYRIVMVFLGLGVFLVGFHGTPAVGVGIALVAISGVLLGLKYFGTDVLGEVGPRARSQNVVGVHRAEGPLVAKGNRPIVIVAHYDTPHESFLSSEPIARFVPLAKRFVPVFAVVSGVFALLQTLPFIPMPVRRVFWIVALLAALPLLAIGAEAIYMRFSPCTDGANDNKSGVAAMLGVLARVRPGSDAADGFASRIPTIPEPVYDDLDEDEEGYDEDDYDEDDYEYEDGLDEGEGAADGAIPAFMAKPKPAPRPVPQVVTERYEEVEGVRHGAEVLSSLRILPTSCEVTYTEPKLVSKEVRPQVIEPLVSAEETVATPTFRRTRVEREEEEELEERPSIAETAREVAGNVAERSKELFGSLRGRFAGLRDRIAAAREERAAAEQDVDDLDAFFEGEEITLEDEEDLLAEDEFVAEEDIEEADGILEEIDDLDGVIEDLYEGTVPSEGEPGYEDAVVEDTVAAVAEEGFVAVEELPEEDPYVEIDGEPLDDFDLDFDEYDFEIEDEDEPAEPEVEDVSATTSIAPLADADVAAEPVEVAEATEEEPEDEADFVDDLDEPDLDAPLTGATVATAPIVLEDEPKVEDVPEEPLTGETLATEPITPADLGLAPDLAFEEEGEPSEEELAHRDISGLDAEVAPELDATAVEPPAAAPSPEPVDDPSWGKSEYQPPRRNVARRAALFDIPDPATSPADPLASDLGSASASLRQRIESSPAFRLVDESETSEDGSDKGGSWKGGAAVRAGLRPEEGEELSEEVREEMTDAVLSMRDDELVAHDIWFVALGGSSLNHAGMKEFLKEYRSEIRGAMLVNISCVGAGDLAVLTREGLLGSRRTNRRLERLFVKIADDLHVPLKRVTRDWADTDATEAMRRTVRAISIVGIEDGGVDALSQTSGDVATALDPGQITDVSEMVTELIRRA